MWNRAALKENAKQMLRKNYWWVVVVSIIFGIAAGNGFSISSPSKNLNKGVMSGYLDGIGDDSLVDNIGEDDSFFSDIDENDLFSEDSSDYSIGNINTYFDSIKGWVERISPGLGIVVLGMLLIVAVAAVCLSIFLLVPLEIGCRRWFLKNRTGKPEMGEIGYVFSHGYVNTVKIMFCKGLFTFFWSLLFIIPGIIKAYEYRMVPYLLAENPEMDFHEAFDRSKDMMTGNKGEAFVLDLSFLGWYILSAFTCGILSIFYVNPYVYLTDTELYVALCQMGGSKTSY